MPLPLQRTDWMPSPPLAPDDGPIDLDHLRRMTLGDAALEREVLTMFVAQSDQIVGALADLPERAGELVHTLKGAARAIGAFAVGDAAAALETALRKGGDESRLALSDLADAVHQARLAIETLLGRG
ncbi:Hpt domain-containing protein [Bradyrhizobium sp. NP1]|jgi:HPt (histidine-containing phosphotransfer) domain-containing protein|uniref:Hpt domain-containing protein n=1 Tax=Bradyrhizobium sp. NP1 TaxID=3049772 RepID=UPI0025A4EEEB|nr:Hpt domain-containing protein [Bradyrhizobium sp. NP1]WJR76262.1 Hpt domain-containing protein [Bradyrhizobium sp. NP1]